MLGEPGGESGPMFDAAVASVRRALVLHTRRALGTVVTRIGEVLVFDVLSDSEKRAPGVDRVGEVVQVLLEGWAPGVDRVGEVLVLLEGCQCVSDLGYNTESVETVTVGWTPKEWM